MLTHVLPQVTIWRRSYDVPPPEMAQDHEYYNGNEAKYKDVDAAKIPKTESLKIVVDRFMPLWEEVRSEGGSQQ